MTDYLQNGHLFVKDFIDSSLCRITEDYVQYKSKTSGLSFNNEPTFIPESMTFYGDNLTESILKHSLPKMEELTGLSLLPTYSFLRLYKRGDKLPKHKDRMGCQIAVSLCIAYSYDENEYQWPIYIDSESYFCKPGEAVLYQGIDQTHWREPLEHDWQLQIFLFYIDSTADFAKDLALDSRPELGLPKSTQKIDIREYEKEYFTSRGYIDGGRATYHD
jgi:hypothetical protein